MVAVLVVLLILALCGVRFAAKALWIIAAVVLVAWLSGHVLRGGIPDGGLRWPTDDSGFLPWDQGARHP